MLKKDNPSHHHQRRPQTRKVIYMLVTVQKKSVKRFNYTTGFRETLRIRKKKIFMRRIQVWNLALLVKGDSESITSIFFKILIVKALFALRVCFRPSFFPPHHILCQRYADEEYMGRRWLIYPILSKCGAGCVPRQMPTSPLQQISAKSTVKIDARSFLFSQIPVPFVFFTFNPAQLVDKKEHKKLLLFRVLWPSNK